MRLKESLPWKSYIKHRYLNCNVTNTFKINETILKYMQLSLLNLTNHNCSRIPFCQSIRSNPCVDCIHIVPSTGICIFKKYPHIKYISRRSETHWSKLQIESNYYDIGQDDSIYILFFKTIYTWMLLLNQMHEYL